MCQDSVLIEPSNRSSALATPIVLFRVLPRLTKIFNPVTAMGYRRSMDPPPKSIALTLCKSRHVSQLCSYCAAGDI